MDDVHPIQLERAAPKRRERVGVFFCLVAFVIVALLLGFAADGVAESFDVATETAQSIVTCAVIAVILIWWFTRE